MGVPVVILLEEVVKFLRRFEHYGDIVCADDEEYEGYDDRGDADCELFMERGGKGVEW